MCWDLTTFWTGFEAIATGVAALAAIVAGFYAAGAWREQQKANQHLADERAAAIKREERAQAELVSVWADGDKLVVYNGSDQTIWMMDVECKRPRNPEVERLFLGGADTIKPHGEFSFVLRAGRERQEWFDRPNQDASIHTSWAPEWTFNDAAARRWRRTSDGELTRIYDEDEDDDTNGE